MDVHASVAERFREAAKGEPGWDQYQSRLWPGFHRPAVTVRLAHSFLVWLERRRHTRQGRRCGPFFPSAAAPATVTPGHAP
jgi:hypothetical protein